MVTVGAIRELAYMSQHLGVPLYVAIDAAGKHLSLKVDENNVYISYQGQRIWEENIYGEGNWFGIESCDSVAKIINCINNGEPWMEKHGWRKSDNAVGHVPFEEALENAEDDVPFEQALKNAAEYDEAHKDAEEPDEVLGKAEDE